MTSFNAIVRDRILRQAILLDAVLRGYLVENFALWEKARKDMKDALLRGEQDLPEWTDAEMRARVLAMRKAFDAATIKVSGLVEKASAEAATLSLDFWTNLFADGLPGTFGAQLGLTPVPPSSILAISARPVLAVTPASWGGEARRRFAREALLELQTAQGLGESVGSAVKRLLSLEQPFGVAERVGRFAAESAVRNSFIGAAARVESLFEERNRDLLTGATFLATLDTTTCQVCASLDGRFFPAGTPRIAIPVHNRCRCVYVPQFKSWKDLGIDIEDTTPAFRASMDGQVLGSTTYDDWIRGLPPDEARSILGPSRWDTWVSQGKPPLGEYVDGTRIKTLGEIA